MQNQKELCRLARAAIAEYIRAGQIPHYQADDPLFLRKAGAYVTLRRNGALRGCIGHVAADKPLYQVVQEMAVAAATRDPRFPPLRLEELDRIKIEISILSPLQSVTEIEQIEIGVHGLMIVHGGRSAVLLPQVPAERGWNRELFLQNLCLKAGLPPDCWTEEPTIFAFTAVVFGEP